MIGTVQTKTDQPLSPRKSFKSISFLIVGLILAAILITALVGFFSVKNVLIESRRCGGIAGNLPKYQCPPGYRCQLEGNYPDASGKCVKK